MSTKELISQKIPPGLKKSETEIYWDDQLQDLMALHEGKVYHFMDLPDRVLQKLQDHLEQDEEAMRVIEFNGPELWKERLYLYAKCRFGAFSYEPDILHNEITPEAWSCSCNSNCILSILHKGIVKTDNGDLTIRELQVLRALCGESYPTGYAVAAELHITQDTLNKHKQNIYAKVGVQSIQELAVWASKMNLV